MLLVVLVALEEEAKVQTDDLEVRGFDNKCILGYFKEKEFLSIVKEWNSKGVKQL
jgi:hypothetical protein